MQFAKYATLLAVYAGVCLAQGYSSVSFARTPPHGIPLKNASMMPAGQPNATHNGILYWGRPVMNKPNGTNVYFIW